ncbi:spore germination protein GerPC [Alkalibacillus aidingensis]|uniref:spore germination protein GerPC n=1 Tax=Alkalibacillus aidingensis TaxID=2747607 RepID=UPI0016614C05|nr:spore germination protein GerPC [Alkalibacillus aidingensis]
MHVHPYILERLARLEEKVDYQIEQMAQILSLLQNMSQEQPEQEESKATIDSVEYHFEQLKIETLEGTLNIGLTPQNDLPFEQIDLPKQEGMTHLEQQAMEELSPFLREELPKAIDEYAQEHDLKVTDEWKMLILQDVQKQVPKRVKEYLSQINPEERVIIENEQIPTIVKHIRSEILKGVKDHIMKIKEHPDER